MDIKVLRNFVEIVDSGSLTAASKKLFIAQPALSNQLKALEKEMNATLLERNSRHQRLTDAGRLFYDRARSILLLEKSMTKEIADFESGNAGVLKIATVPSAAMTMLDQILPDFAKAYPGVRYEFYEKESDAILMLLEEGTVDVGIVRTPCRITPEMEAIYVSDEELVCAYRDDLFTLPDRETISLSDLGSQPVVIIRRYEEALRQSCEKADFTPNLRAVNQQVTINLRWAEAGLGIAIIPENTLSSCTRPLAVRRLADADLSTRRVILTLKNNYLSRATRNFLALCKEKL